MSVKARASKSRILRPVVDRWRTLLRSRRPVDEAWRASLDSEVEQWERYLGDLPEHLAKRCDPDLPLQPEVATLISAPAGATVRILDCGAGPLTFLGKQHAQYRLEIEAVDALADGYDRVLDHVGIVPIVRTKPCESEHLSDLFEEGRFDIACARNTLDHSYDPVQCIREMLRVVKDGGYVLLQHAQDVAVKESYLGMHQWNFHTDGVTVKIWRPGTATDLGEALGATATIERTWRTEPERGGNALHHVVIRKAEAA